MASRNPRICYIPLDERPCNASFPGLHLGHAVDLVVPPLSLLGAKKLPGDVDALADWLERELPGCDACVGSVEQLVYGGLIPSRVHTEGTKTLENRLARLRDMFRRNARININLFALIMRTPAYSSSDEEPDYYEHYGAEIYHRSVLTDLKNLGYEINEDELARLEEEIPESVIADYEHRRAVNRSILERVLELYAEGTVDYVAIPMDDSSRYGYTAADRRYVRRRIVELGLDGQVPVYPGADETGMTLVGRAAVRRSGRTPRVFPYYREEQARRHYPKYEGLELETTVTEHIRAAGCVPAESLEECDLVLAIHSGSRIDTEAGRQPDTDRAGETRKESLHDSFAANVRELLSRGFRVAVADIAYTNGGDVRFVRALDGEGVLASLTAYAGWNTTGNTLGCVIASAVAQYLRADDRSRIHGLLYRLFDDACYQVSVRNALKREPGMLQTQDDVGAHGLDPHSSPALSAERIADKINKSWNRLELRSFEELRPEVVSAELPWNRLFEVHLRLSVHEPAASSRV